MTNSIIESSPDEAAEAQRLAALGSYAILDTPPEVVYDEFAQLAASLLGAPLAALVFVDADRVWLKASSGSPSDPAHIAALCRETIRCRDLLVIADTFVDATVSRLAADSKPLIRFFAAAPLIDSDGEALGCLCIMDMTPRQFTFEQADALRLLSRHAMSQVALRRRIATFKREDTPRQKMLAALKNAVRGGEFVVHYQPKASLHTGKTAGLEALIRWDRPGFGLVSPPEFIPLLEESGLISEVGTWVLGQSADHHRDWTRKGLNPPRIAVNISPAQLRNPRFLTELEGATAVGDQSLGGVDLEISESVLDGDSTRVIEILTAIRKLGYSIALDNFGMGPSSWRYLTRLPIDTLKIDRSFIASTYHAGGLSVVKSMIELAHGLDFKVVAEGVETQAQRDVLQRMGCDEIQGYLLSYPLTKREIEHYLIDAPISSAEIGAEAPSDIGIESEADIELLFGGQAG